MLPQTPDGDLRELHRVCNICYRQERGYVQSKQCCILQPPRDVMVFRIYVIVKFYVMA